MSSILRFIDRRKRNANDAKWWFLHRFHPKHRHHVVNTGLRPGYYDPDILILHSAFQLLCRYVEREMGGEAKIEEFNRDLRADDEFRILKEAQADSQEEALALYRWWKYQRPSEKQRLAELRTAAFDEIDEANKGALDREHDSLEKKTDDDEQVMLHRLITIRRTLWM